MPSTQAYVPVPHNEAQASDMSSTKTRCTEASVPSLHNETQASNMSSSKPPSTTEPPPTLYSDVRHVIRHPRPGIIGMADCPSFTAHHEHHEPTADGSFAVCIADGTGNFISKDLYESIPEKHRSKLNGGTYHVDLPDGRGETASGTALIALILKTADTEERFRIVLRVYVLPKLSVGMFISNPRWHTKWGLGPDGCDHGFDFGDGKLVRVKGLPPGYRAESHVPSGLTKKD